MKHILVCLLIALAIPIAAPAQVDAPPVSPVDIPSELSGFVAAGTVPVAVADADLNGDGTKDYVLATSQRDATLNEDSLPERVRTVMVIVRDRDGKLTVAARNNRAVLCLQCGGVFGDPFAGLNAARGEFTINHYAGSSDRWVQDFTFTYSRRDRTWQLTLVREASFSVFKPNKVKQHFWKPPRSYGRIDFPNFDVDNWKGVGR